MFDNDLPWHFTTQQRHHNLFSFSRTVILMLSLNKQCILKSQCSELMLIEARSSMMNNGDICKLIHNEQLFRKYVRNFIKN